MNIIQKTLLRVIFGVVSRITHDKSKKIKSLVKVVTL